MRYILLDMGSSTVKPYSYENKILTPIPPITINFKKIDFEKEAKEILTNLIYDLKAKYTDSVIKVYATAIFRKQSEKLKKYLIDSVYTETGVFLNIINQELENFYLEKALLGKFPVNYAVMLVNIGGGSTEIVVIQPNGEKETFNIDLGVGTINSLYSTINNSIPSFKKAEIINYVKEQLPDISTMCSLAFYTGGELEYMRLAQYKLQKNTVFNDIEHPSIISLEDFKSKNNDIYERITIETLQSLMPENPLWMLGARACSAISEAIFDKYGVKEIIPSNTNLIHGVIQQEYRSVTLSGSFSRNLKFIGEVAKKFEKAGIKVLSPKSTTAVKTENGFIYLEGDTETPWELERNHLNAIDNSDALILCNSQDYLGSSSLMELGYALSKGMKIVFLEEPKDVTLKALPAEVGLFNLD